MPKRVLLCPPDYFDVVDQKNPYMSSKLPIDRAKAKQQWLALCSALSQRGCEVERIAPVPGLEDMVFAANQIFVGSAPAVGKFAFPSRMVHESRQREVPFYVEWFRARGYKIIDLNLQEDRLEGHGDLLWHPGRSRVYAGYGFRSTAGGVKKVSAAVSDWGIDVLSLRLTDPFCYHLDTCLCPLNEEAALIYAGAYDSASQQKLRQCWQRVHELTAEEAHAFMGNGIVLNGAYLTSHLTPHLEQILEHENLQPVILDTSEFEKAGGSLFCMKIFLPE